MDVDDEPSADGTGNMGTVVAVSVLCHWAPFVLICASYGGIDVDADLNIVIRKQLSHPDLKYQRMGVCSVFHV